MVQGSSSQRTLLEISVEEMRAEITDRSWDTQGTVTIGNVSVLDHISLGERESGEGERGGERDDCSLLRSSGCSNCSAQDKGAQRWKLHHCQVHHCMSIELCLWRL